MTTKVSLGQLNGSTRGDSHHARDLEGPLCCCEYVGETGHRTHILACLCECEALDEMADRCISCRPIPSTLIDRLAATLGHRCRIPSHKGARRLHPNLIPWLLLPFCLYLATLHPVTTVLVSTTAPIMITCCYGVWRRRTSALTGTENPSARSAVFFHWTLASLTICYIVLMLPVNIMRSLLLWEVMLFNTLFLCMIGALIRVRSNPGLVRPSIYDSVDANLRRTSIDSGLPSANDLDMQQQQSATGSQQDSIQGDNGPHEANESGASPRWCVHCNLAQPPRAAHCPACRTCILVRDHHCVWLDTCVGAGNHVMFLVAACLCLVTGLYGCHLALTTVCTPEMYFDWFLFASNCNLVYDTNMTAWIFVTSLYTLAGLVFVLLNVVYQVLLISQGLTSVELHRAGREGRTRCCGLVLGGPQRPGRANLLKNWLHFCTRSTGQQQGATFVTCA